MRRTNETCSFEGSKIFKICVQKIFKIMWNVDKVALGNQIAHINVLNSMPHLKWTPLF